MRVKCIILCVVLSLQYHLISTSDSCQKKSTCSECISDPNICVWCAYNDFNVTTRCMPLGSVNDSWCPAESLQNPQNEKELELEAEDFSSVAEHVIQIKPQRYKLTLRQGMPKSFNFSFQGAKDYPVDLYVLLDASKTMEGIKDMTARKAENIYKAIKNLTNNVHLGFGTFIDKKMLPFMSNKEDGLTYSFRHSLKLVDDFKQFKDKVSKSECGLSNDIPEGGFDALAQVLVCKDIIGWRNESRKIVVFITDGPYHAAGDGKLAGLFQPYDGQCYTENNTYTKELEMDYPSVGMINKLASERDAIVIFLVEFAEKDHYHGLKRAISGSQVVHFYKSKTLVNDDALVSILKHTYEDISKKIKLVPKVREGSKKHLQISFDPDCTTDYNNNPGCDAVIGKEQHIVGTVQYNAKESATVDIVVEGIGEKLRLEINTIQTCDCERKPEINSKYCYGDKRVCGECRCSENRYGDKCSCVKSSEKSGNSDNTTCIAVDGSLCSGNGPCVCGTCQCKKGYTGKFCECNVNSCPRSLDKPDDVCGGHGECDCGICKCKDGWDGEACDCPKRTMDCIEDKSGEVCNGRGKCECGKCKCDNFAEWDARNKQTDKCVIEHCDDCKDRQCVKLMECAKCRRNGQDDCPCDDRITVEVVEFLTEEHRNESLWDMCSNVNVELGCQASFVYRYNDTNYSVDVVVAKDKNCAPTYYIFGGIFLITLLLVGAGTLIAWKLLTDARDRLEYLRFMQHNKPDESVNTNPLYEKPTTTFHNPGFRKKSVDIR
ncbi:hypothetical protein PYW08_001207 [Mythimna loreyi]|uniref:Uncharacterized protein n=1 Tax=Mythimna loreyi TaxID=667449 RepID=A0ACC2R501_9NEOP|nr:hypothetical protein PYW08_001207 [Mythimna loreyi]